MIEEIRKELELKIKELEWKNNLRSLEMIDWIKSLLKKMEEKPAPTPIKKEITVEIPSEEVVKEEKKPAPKKKIVLKKK